MSGLSARSPSRDSSSVRAMTEGSKFAENARDREVIRDHRLAGVRQHVALGDLLVHLVADVQPAWLLAGRRPRSGLDRRWNIRRDLGHARRQRGHAGHRHADRRWRMAFGAAARLSRRGCVRAARSLRALLLAQRDHALEQRGRVDAVAADDEAQHLELLRLRQLVEGGAGALESLVGSIARRCMGQLDGPERRHDPRATEPRRGVGPRLQRR